jgi:hypothetical protein
MSLREMLKNNINEVISVFIKRISCTYDIEYSEIEAIWAKSTNTENIKKDIEVDLEVGKNVLLTYDKAKLVALCKSKGCKYSGTKAELIGRILSEEPKPKAKPKAKSKANIESDIKNVPILKNIRENIPETVLRYNKFNNLEHYDTQLIFSENKIVIGKQHEDGTILPLKECDIDTCKMYKFDHTIQEDLDAGTTLVDVKVEGISDDESEVELLEQDEEDEGDEYEVDE